MGLGIFLDGNSLPYKTSRFGIVGMGALGRAMESFLSKPEASPLSVVLFTVKAHQLSTALANHAQFWPENLPFVIMCNGFVWPIVESLKPKLGRRPIRIGMTTMGSTVLEDGSLKIYADRSLTAWGHWESSQSQPAVGELQTLQIFPNGQWHNDIRPLIRKKWIFNVVINTLCGAFRFSNNGKLLTIRREVEEVLAEVLDLSTLIWSDLPSDLDFYQLLAELWQVVANTSQNENSMARDVRLGLITEKKYLSGYALEPSYGGKHQDMYQRLRQLHHLIPLS